MAMLTYNGLENKVVSKDLLEWFADWFPNPTSSTVYGPKFIETVETWGVSDAQWTAILDELSGSDIETFINIYFMCPSNLTSWGFDNYDWLRDSISNAREAIVKICTEVGFEESQNPFHGFFKSFGWESGVKFTFKNIAELNNALVDRHIVWDELSGVLNSASVIFCRNFYKKSNLDNYLKEWDNITTRNLRIDYNESEGDIIKRLVKSGIIYGKSSVTNSGKKGDKDAYLKVALFTGEWKKTADKNDKIKELSEIQRLEQEFKKNLGDSSSNYSHEDLIKTDKADKWIVNDINEIEDVFKKADITVDQAMAQKIRDYTSYLSHKNKYKYESLEKKNG